MNATKTQRIGMEDERVGELFAQFKETWRSMCDLATLLAKVENEGYRIRGDCEDESDILFKAARAMVAYEDVRDTWED